MILSCPLLHDEAKTAKAKLNRAPKRIASNDNAGTGFVTPNPKCQRNGKPGDTAPSPDDLPGTLVYTRSDMMPTTSKANPSLCLCAARQHVRRNCPGGTSCMMIHDLDIAKWPNATFAKWSALVDKTPALEWNRKVIDPAKVLSGTAKLSASSLAGATTAKSK